MSGHETTDTTVTSTVASVSLSPHHEPVVEEREGQLSSIMPQASRCIPRGITEEYLPGITEEFHPESIFEAIDKIDLPKLKAILDLWGPKAANATASVSALATPTHTRILAAPTSVLAGYWLRVGLEHCCEPWPARFC